MSSSRVASRQRQQHNMDEEDKHETPRRRRHTSPFRRRQREFGLNESYEQEEDQPTPRTNATATERESPRTKRFHAPNDTSLLVAAVDEEEAHAVFAAAMAASGMNFGATEAAAATDDATPVRRNNAQQKVKAAHTPEEQWRSAEEDWQMASGGSRKSTKMHVNSRSPALSSGGGNSRGVMSVSPQRSPAVVANAPTPIDSIVNEQHMENDDDDDDNDSLFDDLGSLGDRSVKSAASGVSRPFLVQRADPDSSDDEEAVLRKQPPLVPKSNPNRPRYPGRKKSSASSVRHSDSESTVAISNTRQRGKPPFERQVVAMMVPEKQVQSPPVSSNNNNNLFQPIASSSPVPVATSARKAVQKPSPQKVSAESAVSPSSRVRMVQEAPPPQASSSPAVDNSWANFDSAFQEDAKVEAGASATPSKQSPSSSGGKKAQEYESLGVAEMTSSQSHGNSTDEQEKILTEMLAKQNISRGEISSDPSLPISQSKSSQFHSESTNGHDEDEDEDDETISVAESMSVYSVSTLGTERTDFSYAPRNSGCTGAARKLSAVPEDNALQCNNKDNPVEWMWSYVEGGINAMNAAFVDATTETKDGASTVDGSDNGASRATSATVGAEEERVQGYNPDGPTDQTFSSLQPISTASDDPDNSFQAWIGYAADLLFPPIANCSNENNFSEGQMEVRDSSYSIVLLFVLRQSWSVFGISYHTSFFFSKVTEDQAAGLVELGAYSQKVNQFFNILLNGLNFVLILFFIFSS